MDLEVKRMDGTVAKRMHPVLTLVAVALWSVCGSARAEQPPVPPEITGSWSIQDVIGTPPMLLEVKAMDGLLGQEVEIGSSLKLWDIYEGTITSFRKDTMLLREMLTYPTGATPRELALGNHRFDIYTIGTSKCRTHGKPLDGCPVFAIGHDLETDKFGLVTFPYGFAAFERIPKKVAGGSDDRTNTAAGQGLSVVQVKKRLRRSPPPRALTNPATRP